MRRFAVIALAAALTGLSACASGHKELKAPCSAGLAPGGTPGNWFSAAAHASDCGPMRSING